jgi:hypothetical protein
MAVKRSEKKYRATKLGSWAFLLGIMVTVISGIVSPDPTKSPVVSLIIILGILVGLLNITRKETSNFLLAAVALAILPSFGGEVLGQVVGIGMYLYGILYAMVIFVVPAALIVAVKTICIEEEA